MAKLSNTTQKIYLTQIQTDNPKYNLSLKLREIGIWFSSLSKNCMKNVIFLNPILVVNEKDCLILLDGYKRVSLAKELGLKKINSVFITNISDKELALHLLYDKLHCLNTPASKAVFLSHLKEKLNLDSNFLIDNVMSCLGLGPNKELLNKYIKISKLPKNVLSFCHKKGLSFKKCLHFTNQKKELLVWLFEMEKDFSLTASICNELLENINDILKREELTLSDFLKLPEIKEVLNDKLDPNKKTQEFRAIVKRLKFPNWTKINNEMKQIKKELLQSNIFEVSWDESLENRIIYLKSKLTSTEDLKRLQNQLHSNNTIEGIKKLFHYI